MTRKENYLRAVRFERPDYIPMAFHINDSCWQSYPQEFLCELIERHPRLFGNAPPPKLPHSPVFSPVARCAEPFTDDFGCVWKTTEDGITGTVTKHPLADWAAFSGYRMPDPDNCCGIGPVDWAEVKRQYAASLNELHMGGLRHGHTFLQLCDIRGYEALMFDMADEEPLLPVLLERLEEFNLGIIRHFLECGVDVMTYAEDLGMQVGPMLSPEHFRRYIQPSYRRLIAPAKEKGIPIHMHSDGDIRTLVDDIIDGGVEIINLQDLVNGIEWIRGRFAGKTCVDLDIDRQSVTRFGTQQQISNLIREEVTKIGSRDGGLTMIYGLYPGVPLENVRALAGAMNEYMDFYS